MTTAAEEQCPSIAQISGWDVARRTMRTAPHDDALAFVKGNEGRFASEEGFRRACLIGACVNSDARVIDIVVHYCTLLKIEMAKSTLAQVLNFCCANASVSALEHVADSFGVDFADYDCDMLLFEAVQGTQRANIQWVAKNHRAHLNNDAFLDLIVEISRNGGHHISAFTLLLMIARYIEGFHAYERPGKAKECMRRVVMSACVRGDDTLIGAIVSAMPNTIMALGDSFVFICAEFARDHGYDNLARYIEDYLAQKRMRASGSVRAGSETCGVPVVSVCDS
jgi:hypothetical protein